MPLDAAGLAVLIGRLEGIADEMGAVLRRAAFSPNIKERADCSAALFNAAGEQLVQAEHIPVHLGAMPASVRAVIDRFPGGVGLGPGDQVVVNDPFEGGTHLNDVTFVAPAYLDGALVGWAANRAHHADLGGAAPGSMPADATEIFQEGLRIPPVLYSPAIRALVLANSRTPDERGGDLDAQVGANVLGVARLAALVERGEPVDEVLAYGERRMRAALSAMDDGSWTFEDVMDSTGEAEDQQRPARIVVTVTVAGDRITFDFTGTDPQRAGNVNAVESVTVSSVAFALRVATDPSIPANAGALRPLSVIALPGTLVAARPPAAVGAGNVEVSQRVADVCLGALALARPGMLGGASQGTMNNLIVGGDGWVYYETLAGGQGARPGRDGMSGVHTGMTNTRNTPIEALEQEFPVRVLRCRLRRDSGGSGEAHGGDGIERDLEVLEDATVSLITERRVSHPWGADGGEAGACGENWLVPGGDESRAIPIADKCTLRVRGGDVIRVLTPGGGGWGSSSLGDLKSRSASTYEATATHFDAPALSFWDRFGTRTVDRARVGPGDRVLDACCGTGASAIPAALAAGPTGTVLGIDLSEPALALGRAKAAARGLRNVELRVGDIEQVDLPAGSFDCVLCVFGVFFLPDIAAGTLRLWDLVAPGGRLAITVWGPNLFEPAASALWEALAAEHAEPATRWEPWSRLTTPAELSALLRESAPGARDVAVEAEAHRHPLTQPEDWWDIVLGTGYRVALEHLSSDQTARVKERTLATLRTGSIDQITADVVYSVAHKPAAQ